MDRTPVRFGRRAGIVAVAPLAALMTLAMAGCGDDGEDTTTASDNSAGELSAIKDYLTDHTAALTAEATTMNELAQEYYDLAEQADFDYAALLAENGDEVQRILDESKQAFTTANPSYEEMEGIVA